MNYLCDEFPKIIHQSWKDKNLRKDFKVWAETWKKHNPSYEYKLWTDEDNFNLISSDFSNFLRSNFGNSITITKQLLLVSVSNN